jgi:hypothetical protein
MDQFDVSTSGTLSLNLGKKKTMCKWKVNAKPNKTKKDTFKVNIDTHVNETHTVVEVDASRNKDTTMNLKGTVTKIQGKKQSTHPIDIKNYKVGTPLPGLNGMTLV